MSVLISGGCGFIGRNIAYRLASAGDEVCVVDNFYRPESRSHVAGIARAGIRVVEVDIRRFDDLKRTVDSFQPDVIVHAAGQVSLVESVKNPIADFEVNALGTLNLLEAAQKMASAPSFVGITSNKVYGDLSHLEYTENADRYLCNQLANGVDESFQLSPVAPYATSKTYADFAIRDYRQRGLLHAVSIRLSSVIGADQDSTETQGWVSWMLKEASANRTINLSGTGKQVRDVLFVDEFAELVASMLQEPSALRSDCYNIGGGPDRALSITELLRFASTFFGQEVKVSHGPPRVGDQKIYVSNVQKIRADIGWAEVQPLSARLEALAGAIRLECSSY